jgi:hypothetical protein
MKKVSKTVNSLEWVTVYIAGKPGFKEEVLRNLGGSRFPFMPGTAENDSLCLFWMDERSALRDFKKAIGSKTVFKYRLHFYPSLEKYNEAIKTKSDASFSLQEKALIYKMSTWEATNRVYRHSA